MRGTALGGERRRREDVRKQLVVQGKRQLRGSTRDEALSAWGGQGEKESCWAERGISKPRIKRGG